MLYKTEFAADFDLGFKLENHPILVDRSYHNDTSPSFWFMDEGQYYVLWVDMADKMEREEESFLRYTVITAINHDSSDSPDIDSSNGQLVFESENYAELSVFLDQFQV